MVTWTEIDLPTLVLKTVGAMMGINLELSQVMKWSHTIFTVFRYGVMLA